MNRFITEYKQLNPEHSVAMAKQAFTESKKLLKIQQVKPDIVMIPDPSPPKKELKKKEVVVPIPEIIEPPVNLEEQEKLKRRMEEQENIKIVLLFWENGLTRVINGEPLPQYPLHPETRRVVTPYDIYRCLDKIEEPPVHTLLTLLASDSRVLEELYRDSQINPLMASRKCVSFYHSRGHVFNKEITTWNDVLLPKLRNEYIVHSKEQAGRKYQKTLDLQTDTITPDTIKQRGVLDSVVSLHELVETLKKNPKLLHSISDTELEYYHLRPNEIMSIRTICAIKDTRSRSKKLTDLFKPKEDTPKSQEPKKSKHTGGTTAKKISKSIFLM